MKCPRCQLENLEEAHFCFRCRTVLPRMETLTGQLPERPPPPPSTLTTGEVFAGRYRILDCLGSGGMGRVYRVYDQELSMEVALKVLHPRFTLDDQAVERFRDELKLARQISHRNICRLYDIGRAGDQLFISMELIVGETLRTLIAQRGTLLAGQALEILREMAEGLIEAHRHGIVHRDLKPQNVMVDEQGHVKVMDFGIAVSLHEEHHTESGVVLGTPQYMAPEQVSGAPADHRVDVYALGIIGYEMLTGAPPFTGESAMKIACRQVTDPTPDPRQKVSDLPSPVCDLLRRMLVKDPGQRIPDMKSLVGELDALLHPVGELPRPQRPRLRGRRGLFLGLAALSTLGATGLFLLWHQPAPAPPPKHPAIAVLYFRNNTGRPALDNWRTALADLLTTDLSQSLHLRMISSDRLVDLLDRLKMQNVQNYSSADIHRLSEAEHFRYVLLGSYSLAGDMFRIDVALKDLRNDEIVAVDKTIGRGEESIFRMIDELTRRVKLGFNLSPAETAGDIDHELGRVTTGSVAAYKLYQRGKELYRNRSFTESREAMRQAVAIDPEFALAHYWLAMDSLYLGDVEQAKAALKAAMDHLDRTSERERFLIRAFTTTWLDNDPERAVTLYRELLRLYPEDEPALIQLGSLHRNLQNWPQAEQVFTRLLAVNPRSRFGYENLCGIRQAQGRYVEALEVLRRGRPYVSDASWFPYLSAETRLLMGDAPAALQEARNAAVSTPKVPRYRLLTAAAFMLTGQEDDARREYREVLDRWPEVAGWEAILGLARLEMQYGRYLTVERLLKEAEENPRLAKAPSGRADALLLRAYCSWRTDNPAAAGQIDLAWKLYRGLPIRIVSQEVQTATLAGLIALRLGKQDETMRQSRLVEESIRQNHEPWLKRYHLLLQGRILAAQQRSAEALPLLRQAVSMLPQQQNEFDDQGFFFEALAEEYYRTGQLDLAQAQFERILTLTLGRLEHPDVTANAHYWLGKIALAKRDSATARRHFQAFTVLFAGSQPPSSHLTEARRWMASEVIP